MTAPVGLTSCSVKRVTYLISPGSEIPPGVAREVASAVILIKVSGMRYGVGGCGGAEVRDLVVELCTAGVGSLVLGSAEGFGVVHLTINTLLPEKSDQIFEGLDLE